MHRRILSDTLANPLSYSPPLQGPLSLIRMGQTSHLISLQDRPGDSTAYKKPEPPPLQPPYWAPPTGPSPYRAL